MKLRKACITLVSLGIGLAGCNSAIPSGYYFPVPGRYLEVVHSEVQMFRVDTLLTDLSRPWSMAFLPDGRVLIAERAGNLLIVEDGQLREHPAGGAVPEGLRDLALHPDYEANGWLYLSYYLEPTEDDGGYTVLIRGRLEGNQLVDAQELYRAGPFEKDGEWYGSRIAFDRDGYVFFTVGIRGANRKAQDLSLYSGKTMRLYEDGSIPTDNPFVDSAGALPEIYTYGHRMHEGLARYPVTGAIWSHEHGEMGGDEINILGAGLNYGWPEVTYSLNYDGTIISEDTLREGMEPPVHHWTPSIGPSGMDFAIGSRYPGWEGNLFSGALAHRLVMRSVIEDSRVVHEERLLEGIGRVRDVEVAPDGLLYLITEDKGLLIRLLPVE